ncbi:proton-conducting transporter transmembrane domain-containing protein [Agilicoccus flavus]|uniref:proton-conducting transporter transmembrane domain-containing protein n=1 Tax=Agilicoccus flavus TaxID=2775968 RepID=UPI001CF6B8C6|nr:proton-conducting transporter membrane subunit [Agilicoccus flavus]
MSPAALLPLLVAVPLLAAGVTVVVRVAAVQRALLVGVPAATAVAGLALLRAHAATPVLADAVGAFEPGIAIPFVSDTLTAVMLVVTGATTAVCAWFLCLTGEDRYRFVPPLALMLTGGVNGALLTGDLFNLFVFVEVMLLPSYALIAVTGSWRRLGIGRMFVLVNLVTSTFLLMGAALVYGAAGTVNLAALAGAAADDPQVGLAVSVVLLALLVKGGIVPVHGWLPRAYPATSAGIMALFAGLHTKVGLYAVYRIVAVAYGGQIPWAGLFGAAVVLTILVGALGTNAERRMRGGIAYQMVSGVGHILVGVALFTPAALAAGVFYLVHHIVTVGALVLAVGAVEHTYGTGRLDRLSGLMRRERWASAIVGLGLFSLVGLPPTSGLWGKVGLVLASAAAPSAWGVVFIVAMMIASVISLLALQRWWVAAFGGPPLQTYRPDDPEHGRGVAVPLPDDVRIPGRLLAPATVLIAVSVVMFAGAGVLFPVAQDAAGGLLDVGPYVEAVLGR